MKESARYILPILVFVALILSIGTSGYLLIEEDMSVNNAFYMTVTAITPTQFDEVHKLSVPGRYFTVLLVFCGFGAVVAFATQFARLIIQSELEGVGIITRKQMGRRIRRMKNHYIVCGYAEIGGAICGELRDHQLPFVVITGDESSMLAVEREGYALVRGNPTADASLREAGIERACGVIAVLADDADNLIISLAARELNPQVFIIARGEDSSIEDRILRAGADIVVSPVKLGGRQIAELIQQQAGASLAVDASAPQSSVMGLRMKVYRHSVDAPISVADVLSQSGAVGAAGIYRRDGSFEPSPPRDATVCQDDALVTITRTEEASGSIHKPPTGRTILLADDHRAMRLLFARKLAAAGHDVIQAATGDEALRMADLHSPGLIVLDVNMPKQDGYEVCAALRKTHKFAGVPIILYSGEETAEFVQRGLASGADRCIRKTSKSSELLASIEEVFSTQRTPSVAVAVGVADTVEATNSSSGSESSSSVFDIDIAMEHVGGDLQLLDELVKVMLEETPLLMERIRLAVAGPDPKDLQIAAHTLRSSTNFLGASAASAAAASMESAGRDGDLENLEQLHGELRTQIDTVMVALEKHFGARHAK